MSEKISLAAVMSAPIRNGDDMKMSQRIVGAVIGLLATLGLILTPLPVTAVLGYLVVGAIGGLLNAPRNQILAAVAVIWTLVGMLVVDDGIDAMTSMSGGVDWESRAITFGALILSYTIARAAWLRVQSGS